MSTITPIRTSTTVIASTSNAVGATKRGTLDLRGKVGALVYVSISNNATGPTAPAVCNFLVSYSDGATPAQASAGADWKTYRSVSGTNTNNGKQEFSFWVQDVQHLEIEFFGNTGQPVTVEALATITTSYQST